MAVPVGHRFPERVMTIEPHRVDEYVTALGVSPTPEWMPTVGAAVPPGFLMFVVTYGADVVHGALDVDFTRAVYGGMDAEFFRPVLVGDTIRVAPFVSDIRTKKTSGGELTFIDLTCEYFLPDGTLAAREVSTTIQRG